MTHEELLARIENLEAAVFKTETERRTTVSTWKGKPLITKEDWDAMYADKNYVSWLREALN